MRGQHFIVVARSVSDEAIQEKLRILHTFSGLLRRLRSSSQ